MTIRYPQKPPKLPRLFYNLCTILVLLPPAQAATRKKALLDFCGFVFVPAAEELELEALEKEMAA